VSTDVARPRLDLTRAQVLAYRRSVNALDERLPAGSVSLRRAAWAGLQDSMPRAALLSIHARVEGTQPSTWEDPSLVQLWGPRFSAYVVATRDVAAFTLGRLPDIEKDRRFAEAKATALHEFLGGRRMSYGEAGRGLGVHPNSFRYGAPTGRILMRWDGARQPTVWTVPPPDVEPAEARLELARRFLHVFGPSLPSAFAQWAGIKPPRAQAAFKALDDSLVPVRTPVGEAWILAEGEAAFLAPPGPVGGPRLLPSGDAYWLSWGADRELLVPEAERRAELWTPRVWPGGLLLDGELAGTWRRADAKLEIIPWRRCSPAERDAIQVEAESLPLPGVAGRIQVRWVE
jgi:hypothetical protein